MLAHPWKEMIKWPSIKGFLFDGSNIVNMWMENARGCPLFTSYYPFSLFLGGKAAKETILAGS